MEPSKRFKDRSVALIVFYDESGRILLQDRRSISKKGEEWGFFGGGIEERETPKEAIVREAKEELSFDLDEFEFLGEDHYDYPEGNYLHSYLFISPLRDKLNKFNLNEGDGMKMFSFDEARKLKMGRSAPSSLSLIEKHLLKNRQ